MILKSLLKKAINEVLEEEEVDGRRALSESLVDRLTQEFGDEIFDDDEEEAESEEPSVLGGGD